MVTTFCSTDSRMTLCSVHFCSRRPYLIYVLDSRTAASGPAAPTPCLEAACLTFVFAPQGEHRLLAFQTPREHGSVMLGSHFKQQHQQKAHTINVKIVALNKPTKKTFVYHVRAEIRRQSIALFTLHWYVHRVTHVSQLWARSPITANVP